MGFLSAPKLPTPPPPPNPPTVAGGAVQQSAAQTAAAAAAAEGSGFGNTLETSPEGADKPSTAANGAKAQLGA